MTHFVHCTECGTTSHHSRFTSYFYTLPVSTILASWEKFASQQNPPPLRLARILALATSFEYKTCDVVAGGCGATHQKVRSRPSSRPNYFIVQLAWERGGESRGKIEVLTRLLLMSGPLFLPMLFTETSPPCNFHPVAMLCYYGKHWQAYVQLLSKQWHRFDDGHVAPVGSLDAVADAVAAGKQQLSLVFYRRDQRPARNVSKC